jgi:hypothetical protein
MLVGLSMLVAGALLLGWLKRCHWLDEDDQP